MTKYLVLAFALAACGPKPGPVPPPPPPAPDAAVTAEAMAPEQCTAKGGQVKGDIGDGKVACAEGETELGRVTQGIEGAICCAAAVAPAPAN